MSQPKLEVTTDFTERFNDVIKKFKNDKVLVGIPQQDTNRNKDEKSEEEKEPINNAALLAINEFGSPVNNIPPRPVMAIGIKNAQDGIAEEFKKAAQSVLKSGFDAVNQYYERAGIIASTSVKKAINDQEGIKELKKSTIAARKREGFKGTKALIRTGQMRNAITYVVKEGL